MEHKSMELIPHDVWQLISQRLSQKERSSARAVSRFFFKRFTPEWDRYSRDCQKIRAIAVGGNHSLLLTETGELFGCGSNNYGQLGLGHTELQASWTLLCDKIHIRAIAAGGNHNLLLSETGEIFECGYNRSGKLGLGHTKLQASWISLSEKTPIHAIAAGEDHNLMLRETGELFGCGYNGGGQLGLGHTKDQASWIKLTDNTPVRAIAASWNHSVLLTETGELFGCGLNQYGQLGLEHTQNQTTWVRLNPFPKSHVLRFEELLHQRHRAFQSELLKILLKQCDALFQLFHAEDDRAQRLALFSTMKASLQAQLTEPLPAPWDQEYKVLDVDEFNPFYQRLREQFKLPPTEDSSSLNRLTLSSKK